MQVTNLGLTVQDRPAQHLRAGDAARLRRPGRGRRRAAPRSLENAVLWQGNTRNVRLGPRRSRSSLAAARRTSSTGSSAWRGDGREGRRRRTSTSRWHEGLEPLVLGDRLRLLRGEADPARQRLPRPRGLQAGRGGAAEGDPAQRHQPRHEAAAARDRGRGHADRHPGHRDRQAQGHARRVGRGRLDTEAAGGRRPLGTYAVTLAVEGQNRHWPAASSRWRRTGGPTRRARREPRLGDLGGGRHAEGPGRRSLPSARRWRSGR
ncbi:MAG: hypothetical protein MZV64_23825 [Ignavibacteriales bacterium]|nr:hypothetical protein [Ignavibacteriales bacterium]